MNIPKVYLCAAVLLLPTLAGCGGSSSGTNTAGPIMFVPRTVTAPLSNGLTGSLTEDRSTVSVGGTVTYTATLTNPTAQPVTYQYYIGPGSFAKSPAALSVTNPSGQAVFPFGAESQAVGISPPTMLAPGQSVSATIAVGTTTVAGTTVSPGFSAAGQYTANASFLIIPGALSGTPQIGATAGPLLVTVQ